jgi:hypothetical protein
MGGPSVTSTSASRRLAFPVWSTTSQILKRHCFPAGTERAAYRFDFADQHVLSRTLGIERVARRLCFDSAALTCLLELLRHWGVLRTLRHRWVRDALVALLSRFHVGSDRFAVKVEAERLIGKRPYFLYGLSRQIDENIDLCAQCPAT